MLIILSYCVHPTASQISNTFHAINLYPSNRLIKPINKLPKRTPMLLIEKYSKHRSAYSRFAINHARWIQPAGSNRPSKQPIVVAHVALMNNFVSSIRIFNARTTLSVWSTASSTTTECIHDGVNLCSTGLLPPVGPSVSTSLQLATCSNSSAEAA